MFRTHSLHRLCRFDQLACTSILLTKLDSVSTAPNRHLCQLCVRKPRLNGYISDDMKAANLFHTVISLLNPHNLSCHLKAI